MLVRQEIFDTYWYFAAERQAVFFRRLQNSPPPWTHDSILATYKFCNAYRASDRVSQFLIKEVIYTRQVNEEDLVLKILLFKFFNQIATWQYLEGRLGEVCIRGFSFDVYDTLLQEFRKDGGVIYNNAYMSCATKAFGYDLKHQNTLALLQKMLCSDKIITQVLRAKSFHELFLLLRSYPLIGDFMAYQLATDINYSELTNFSENDFTVVGPGSRRGIRKCFQDTDQKSDEYVIRWMQENQEKEFKRLGLSFQSLWGRPLQLIDCQNLFCETDKYCRVAFPALKSNRTKIKAKYQSSAQPMHYFYPPKWGINHLLPIKY